MPAYYADKANENCLRICKRLYSERNYEGVLFKAWDAFPWKSHISQCKMVPVFLKCHFLSSSCGASLANFPNYCVIIRILSRCDSTSLDTDISWTSGPSLAGYAFFWIPFAWVCVTCHSWTQDTGLCKSLIWLNRKHVCSYIKYKPKQNHQKKKQTQNTTEFTLGGCA